MPSFHIQINTSEQGERSALEHAQYIQRHGPFSEERYGAVAARGHGNFPAWAGEDLNAFWRASDAFERANGNTYREFELALPRELSAEERVALVERFARQEFGESRTYQWAIHHCTARDGKEQPHVHLMFSDRQHDGIERGPEQFFKRYNAKNPERGGARKMSYGATKAEAALAYEGIRARWANTQNQALENAGVEARVDHRSLAAQGITHREPQLHRGPAVSGIEARGEVSEVGERQREQRQARSLARAAVVAEVRVVTREEVAVERVAVRERRELAASATGAERTVVLKLVEADRREQLGRAQAAAEQRIERRQGLGMGALRDKLLAQARALRERLGQQLEKVREWVRERFAAPKRRDFFEVMVEKALAARDGELAAPGAVAEPAPELTRSMEETRAEGRQQWLQARAAAKAAGEPKTLEGMQAEGRAEWLRARERARLDADFSDRPRGAAAQPVPAAAQGVSRDAEAVERERLAGLSVRELKELIGRIAPAPVEQLVQADPAVAAVRERVEGHQHAAHQAVLAKNAAAAEAHEFRRSHGMQAKLHDVGAVKAAYLLAREAAGINAEQRRLEALAASRAALAELEESRREAQARITQATQPARAKAAELKKLMLLAAEREQPVTEFEQLAHGRAAGFYPDTSTEWQATPPRLRKMIDAFNRQSAPMQADIVKEMTNNPGVLKTLGAELELRRNEVRERSRDRGWDLER